jgi:hypothetical protein
VLKHLKKKVGDGIYDEEYNVLMDEIIECLNKQQKDKENKASEK